MKTVFVILLACAAQGYAESGTRSDRPTSPVKAQTSVASPGDRVVLRSGLSLRGLRVLSETSIDVRVEVLPGKEPLILPAGQVTEVIYAPRESIDESPGDAPPPPAQELLPARKISPIFSKRLAAAMVDRKRVYTDRDLVSLLEEVASEHNITITIDEALQALPSKQREVTVTVTPELSLEEFLRRVLAEAAPWLQVETRFDEVLISLRPDAGLEQ